MLRIITKDIHAYLDYPVALGLIIMPFVFGIGDVNPLACYLSIATGVAAFFLTLLTDHQFGVFKVLPYKMHLAVDGMVGAVFVLAPLLLGFSGLEMAYYLVLGATVLLVVSLHKPDQEVAHA